LTVCVNKFQYFQECISKSAIITKFNGHTSTGISIAKEMVQIMEQIIARASSHRYFHFFAFHCDMNTSKCCFYYVQPKTNLCYFRFLSKRKKSL